MTGLLLWRAGVVSVQLVVPAGFHVAEAPSRLDIGGVQASVVGDPRRLRLPSAEGEVDARLAFAVCRDDNTACVNTVLVGHGRLDRKSRVSLAPPVEAAVATSTGTVAHVYDFWAVWCPPCNQMAAEVLEGPLPYAVERIDVDAASSWELKSKHHIGGYPTVLAVDAQGAEVGRLVGYPGKAQTLDWFASLAKETPLNKLRGATVLPEDEGRAARRFAEVGDKEEARAHLARAVDGVDTRIARLTLDPTKADAAWLAANAPGGDWIYPALDVDPTLLPVLAPKIAALPASGAADVFFVMAGKEPERATAYNAAALALLGAARTGEPDHDRSLVSAETDALAALGRLQDALDLLDRYVKLYPTEFTWDFVAANRLNDAGRFAEAETRATRAMGLAIGDQRLRVAMTLAKAMAGEGRKADAVGVLDAVLASTPAPDAALEVRSHRYRKQIAELRAKLAP